MDDLRQRLAGERPERSLRPAQRYRHTKDLALWDREDLPHLLLGVAVYCGEGRAQPDTAGGDEHVLRRRVDRRIRPLDSWSVGRMEARAAHENENRNVLQLFDQRARAPDAMRYCTGAVGNAAGPTRS